MHEFFQTPDRRFKILWISPELLLANLFGPIHDEGEIRCVKIDGLPEGCRIQAVCYDGQRDSFGIRLYHESFELVEETQTASSLSLTFHSEWYHVMEDAETIKRNAARAMRSECTRVLRGFVGMLAKYESWKENDQKTLNAIAKAFTQQADYLDTLPLTQAHASEIFADKPKLGREFI